MLKKLEIAINELKKYYPKLNSKMYTTHLLDNKDLLRHKKLNQALFYLSHQITGEEISINQHFETFGTMIDLSRNAVMKVDYLKEVIRKKALMGVNKIMLYMEDVYTIESEPYFGYMRGRYSEKELLDIVNYANIFDITLVPSIQTLGHLGQFLRWGYNSKVKDLPTVILAGEQNTYILIEKMIKTLRKVFNTDEIHIGLDETFGLGFGQYYKNNGYVPQYDIFIDHLKMVNNICLKYNFNHVLIWSDMFFRISSKSNEYYDPNVTIDLKIRNAIPKNIKLVYWDYYNSNPDLISRMIEKHQTFNQEIIVASGTWIWTKLAYDKKQTDKTAKVHIDQSIKHNIKEIYFTQWNDDGSPANYDTSFLGVYEMAEYSLTKERKVYKKVFDFINDTSYESAVLVSKINESPIQPLPLLWDDPLNGIYLNNELAKNNNIITESISFFNQYLNNLNEIKNDFNVDHNIIISKLLKNKLKIRQLLVTYYKESKNLKSLIPDLKEAMHQTDVLLNSFRTMWLKRNKAFGLDVIQSRLATLKYRFKETIDRINDYCDNKLDRIDELEETMGPNQYIRMNHMNIAYSSVHILSY